jgi:hypothetical protein
MFTKGLITTPLPTLAPNKRNKKRLIDIIGNAELKKTAFNMYHDIRLTELPPFLYQSLLNFDKSVFNCVSITLLYRNDS